MPALTVLFSVPALILLSTLLTSLSALLPGSPCCFFLPLAFTALTPPPDAALLLPAAPVPLPSSSPLPASVEGRPGTSKSSLAFFASYLSLASGLSLSSLAYAARLQSLAVSAVPGTGTIGMPNCSHRYSSWPMNLALRLRRAEGSSSWRALKKRLLPAPPSLSASPCACRASAAAGRAAERRASSRSFAMLCCRPSIVLVSSAFLCCRVLRSNCSWRHSGNICRVNE